MSEYQALADFYRSAAAEGGCYECGRSITVRNRRRGAWCESCEMGDSKEPQEVKP